MYTTPLYCTGALYTCSHTVSNNESRSTLYCTSALYTCSHTVSTNESSTVEPRHHLHHPHVLVVLADLRAWMRLSAQSYRTDDEAHRYWYTIVLWNAQSYRMDVVSLPPPPNPAVRRNPSLLLMSLKREKSERLRRRFIYTYSHI